MHARMNGRTDRFVYSLTPCTATCVPIQTGRYLLEKQTTRAVHHWTHALLHHHEHAHFSPAFMLRVCSALLLHACLITSCVMCRLSALSLAFASWCDGALGCYVQACLSPQSLN